MPASIFISHVYENSSARDTIRTWATRGLLGPDVVVTGESEDHRQDGPNAIRGHLSPKLQGASAVLVLVGDDTHNHEWVDYEAQHALSNRKLVVPVRIPGTRGGVPPAVSHLRIIQMDPTAIRTALGY
jgi:hypothetical protein